LFNLLCIAYGGKPKLFGFVVQKRYLPKERAESCANEHAQVAFALKTLLKPHVEPEALAQFEAAGVRWRPKAKR
jgi:hypothetical protein